MTTIRLGAEVQYGDTIEYMNSAHVIFCQVKVPPYKKKQFCIYVAIVNYVYHNIFLYRLHQLTFFQWGV